MLTSSSSEKLSRKFRKRFKKVNPFKFVAKQLRGRILYLSTPRPVHLSSRPYFNLSFCKNLNLTTVKEYDYFNANALTRISPYWSVCPQFSSLVRSFLHTKKLWPVDIKPLLSVISRLNFNYDQNLL